MITSVDDMYAFAARLVASLCPQEQAVVIGLTGDLGAGKTTFTQGVARALGVDEVVTSPTFVLEKIYDTATGDPKAFARLVHIDAYRLDDAHELHQLGFSALVSDPENLIVVEWPERVVGALPSETRNIVFRFINETTRGVTEV